MTIRAKLDKVCASAAPVKIDVAIWGAEVYLRPITGKGADEHRELLQKVLAGEEGLDDVAIMRSVVAEHLVEKDGARMYDLDNEEDLDAFLQLPHAGVTECYGLIISPDLAKRARIESAKGKLRGAREKQ